MTYASIKKGNVLLINPNAVRPLIAPIALDYLAAFLQKNGYDTEILDLAFCSDTRRQIADCLSNRQPDVVGITVRNTDDCYCASQEFFVPRIKSMVELIRQCTQAPIVFGGCGFSVMPMQILRYCSGDYGIKGDGERAFLELVERLINERDPWDIRGLVYKNHGRISINEPDWLEPFEYGTSAREAIDNRRYFLAGGQGNIETKRGCNKSCIYCADPVAKGPTIRLKHPVAVVDELEELHAQGINCFHLCDSEFNNPIEHAASVCTEIIRSDLSGKITWYAYASPKPFSAEIGKLMKRAGCAGIDFGVDSGQDSILSSLGRDFVVKDIVNTAKICKSLSIPFMFDLLLGGPAETKKTVVETIKVMKRLMPSCVGISLGIRVYPGTDLAEAVRKEGNDENNKNLVGSIKDNDNFFRPVFYRSSRMGANIGHELDVMIGSDRRFFFANPDNKNQNYNYNDNDILVNAIKNGHKGAYWDILRRLNQEQEDG